MHVCPYKTKMSGFLVCSKYGKSMRFVDCGSCSVIPNKPKMGVSGTTAVVKRNK